MDAVPEAALPFVAWSRIWSPLAQADRREEAWHALALPGRFEDCESAFISAFVVGLPGPEVPLILHAALGRDGGAVREDWMRVVRHLGLRWSARALPPDHLAAACDVLTRAVQLEETVLIDELRKRYLEPWCTVASEKLAGKDASVACLPAAFATDVAALSG